MLQVGDDEVPDVLVLVGILGVHAGAARFAAYLDEALERPRTLDWQGSYRGLRVALAACFGGPMAAYFAHAWCSAGVTTVLQLGWYGALQHGSRLGDVLVPRHAERQDGVSDWYLPKGILADAAEPLAERVRHAIEARGIPVDSHAIYSTPALLAESRDVIGDWSRHGYRGVDMETAATFAVARSMGVQRAAALIRLDDLVGEQDSLADAMSRESRAFLREREREVMHASLDAVLDLRGRP